MVHVSPSLINAPRNVSNISHANRIIAPKPAPKSDTPATPATTDPGANFRALFSGNYYTAAPTALNTPPPPPTAQSMFGPNPWATNPGGMAPNGVTYGYNPYYFATPATAQKVAQMVGGKVVETNAITPFGPFQQNQPNQMVQLPNGRVINAGLFASFYDHGYSQQFIDRLVSSEINDGPA
jgi:hypothetical protein